MKIVFSTCTLVTEAQKKIRRRSFILFYFYFSLFFSLNWGWYKVITRSPLSAGLCPPHQLKKRNNPSWFPSRASQELLLPFWIASRKLASWSLWSLVNCCSILISCLYGEMYSYRHPGWLPSRRLAQPPCSLLLRRKSWDALLLLLLLRPEPQNSFPKPAALLQRQTARNCW